MGVQFVLEVKYVRVFFGITTCLGLDSISIGEICCSNSVHDLREFHKAAMKQREHVAGPFSLCTNFTSFLRLMSVRFEIIIQNHCEEEDLAE